MNTPRKAAKAAGHARFVSTPCKVCGCPERYTSCGNCVACNKRRSREQGRDPVYVAKHVEAKKRRLAAKKAIDSAAPV